MSNVAVGSDTNKHTTAQYLYLGKLVCWRGVEWRNIIQYCFKKVCFTFYKFIYPESTHFSIRMLWYRYNCALAVNIV